MKTKLFSYNVGNTVIHRMSGGTKFLCFVMTSLAAMLTYDIRVLLFIALFSYSLLPVAKITWKQIRGLMYYFFAFLWLNVLLTYLFSPEAGVEMFGTRTLLLTITSRYTITVEQLLDQFAKAMKYIAVIPMGMIFIFTTESSEFAASLSTVGITYKISYAVSLTLRYFPDVQRDYQTISLAQQARGLEMSNKAKLLDRFKYAAQIIFPLIISSLTMIEKVTNAMDLRGFGKKRKRTWYSRRPMNAADYGAIAVTGAIAAVTILMMVFAPYGRFWNPMA